MDGTLPLCFLNQVASKIEEHKPATAYERRRHQCSIMKTVGVQLRIYTIYMLIDVPCMGFEAK